MKVWSAAVLLAIACLSPGAAAAADDKTSPSKNDDASKPPIVLVSVTREAPDAPAPRSMFLKGMYATSIGLQAFDGYSTMAGLRSGNVELNPMMKSVAQNPTTLFVAKATMTLTTIAIADTLWRSHHRGQAIAVMVVSNGLMAAVAAKNASVLR